MSSTEPEPPAAPERPAVTEPPAAPERAAVTEPPAAGEPHAGATPTVAAEPPATHAPRVYRGELTSAVSALLLLALMFLTKWYGVAGVPDPSAARPAMSTAEDAWNGLSIVRWVMLLAILVALGSVLLHASQRAHGTRTDTSLVVLGAGAVVSALLIYRVLINLPQASSVIDQKLGAVLGVACAIGIAVGGVESVHENRTLRRAVAVRPRHRRRLVTGRTRR